MKYLYSYIDQTLKRLESRKVLLLLDYDGTLTPIVRRPELARLSLSSRRLLQNLSDELILGIISGRSLKDIKDLVKIPGIIYAGNHGLEIEFPGMVYIHPRVRGFSKRLDRIATIFHQRLNHIPGIIVEHKGLTLSLHYRCVNRLRQAGVRRIFNNIINPLIKAGRVKTRRGKKVFEVCPPVEWDKGRAVAKIIEQIKGEVLPIYIGDDVTDEDAFKAIRDKGISIYVGRLKKSHAQYFVWNVREVVKFLKMVYSPRKNFSG